MSCLASPRRGAGRRNRRETPPADRGTGSHPGRPRSDRSPSRSRHRSKSAAAPPAGRIGSPRPAPRRLRARRGFARASNPRPYAASAANAEPRKIQAQLASPSGWPPFLGTSGESPGHATAAQTITSASTASPAASAGRDRRRLLARSRRRRKRRLWVRRRRRLVRWRREAGRPEVAAEGSTGGGGFGLVAGA